MQFIGLGRLGESAVNSTGLVDVERDIHPIMRNRWRLEDTEIHKERGAWRPQDGREAAEESLEEGNYDFLEDATEGQVLIVAQMGEGVGAGAAPVLAEFAKSQGLLTVALVTKPFRFEGKRRTKWAEDAIAELERVTDMIVVAPNDSLFALTDQLVTVEEAFLMATRTMAGITRCVAEIVRYKPPRGSRRRKSPVGRLGLPDLMDAEPLLKDAGPAWAANGYGRGVNGAQDAVAAVVANPLLDPVDNATRAILLLAHGSDVEQDSLIAACQIVRNSVDPGIDLLLAQTSRGDMEDEVHAGLLVIGTKPDSTGQVDSSEMTD